VSSSYCACGHRPIRGLDSLCTKLFPIVACCLVVVALPGCGYAANASATDTTNDADKQIAQVHRGHFSSLSALSCSSASMTGSGSDSCTVTLTGAAGYGGMSVSLASSNAAVTVPATVTFAPNTSSAGFTAI
jgi:hypothetical protein